MAVNAHAFLHAVMVHCRERGDEMIVGDLSHLHIYEQGGSAQVSVLQLHHLECAENFEGLSVCLLC